MGEVVYLDVVTTQPIPVSRVLDNIPADMMDDVLVIGVMKDGTLYTATSTPNAKDMLWMIELFRRQLFDLVDDGK